jgi:hypothetical protein
MDTKTHFVWSGGDKRENDGKRLFLVVQNGAQKTGASFSSEIDVRFARAELGQIKWCSYIAVEDQDVNKCKPTQSLKPDGVIDIK